MSAVLSRRDLGTRESAVAMPRMQPASDFNSVDAFLEHVAHIAANAQEFFVHAKVEYSRVERDIAARLSALASGDDPVEFIVTYGELNDMLTSSEAFPRWADEAEYAHIMVTKQSLLVAKAARGKEKYYRKHARKFFGVLEDIDVRQESYRGALRALRAQWQLRHDEVRVAYPELYKRHQYDHVFITSVNRYPEINKYLAR